MALRTATPQREAPAGPALARALEGLLRELALVQTELLALAAEHRAAIARADTSAIAGCIARQAVLAERSRTAEHQRRAIIEQWSPRERGITLTELASRVDEPDRSRLLGLAGQVRALVERLARENRTVRAATESLMAHMDGLVRQVARRLSQSGTYGRRGLDAGAPLAAGFDLCH
jgi:hypothetical protein